jgi:hypothetical protein
MCSRGVGTIPSIRPGFKAQDTQGFRTFSIHAGNTSVGKGYVSALESVGDCIGSWVLAKPALKYRGGRGELGMVRRGQGFSVKIGMLMTDVLLVRIGVKLWAMKFGVDFPPPCAKTHVETPMRDSGPGPIIQTTVKKRKSYM